MRGRASQRRARRVASEARGDARCWNAAGVLSATFSEESQAGELFSDWRDCWAVVDRCFMGGPCPATGQLVDPDRRLLTTSGSLPTRCLTESSDKNGQLEFTANQGECRSTARSCVRDSDCAAGRCQNKRCGAQASRRWCNLESDGGAAPLGWTSEACSPGVTCGVVAGTPVCGAVSVDDGGEP